MRRLRASRQGNIATMTALMMPVLIGSAGLASDTIQWTLTKRMMQRAADSGAIAGAYQLSQTTGSNNAGVLQSARNDITRNGGFPMSIAPVINSPATSGSFRDATSAVEVILATDLRLPFTGLIMGGPMRISARAVAEVVGNGDYCVLALENTNTPGIPIGGSATVNLGCGMMSNAPSTTSIIANGASNVTASPVAAVGNVPPGNYAAGTVRESYALPLRDPYRNLPDPINIANSNNDLRVQPNRSSTFSSGTYRNIDVSGTATFNPGVYYVTGSVNFGSQANVTANGVVFILTATNIASNTSNVATVGMQGGARLNMAAPSTGTYAGILFYQDRRATNTATNIINGNSSSLLQGALYFPRQELQMNGTSGMNTRCLQIVARRVDWRGNTNIQNVCPANSGAGSFKGTQIKLVA
ncbi:pilus assembly protein TadG-related protein [Sandarakinorhabdus sp.]|uniref:pilus assembly protein TadG-related protein n=1 Tax=Sandarakinorhabdus sp. TaxID=1916663 RepID=UPI00286E3894|nr:pilus assembly protein TadG-related protein [Sandarakinorhabdus sp.]